MKAFKQILATYDMKALTVILLVALTVTLINTSQVYAQLENTELNARSGVITLDIEFGPDKIKHGLFSTIGVAQLESIYLSFYGDEIILTEPEISVGINSFRISSIPEGIMMFGYKNTDIGNYDIDIFFATEYGTVKLPVSTIIPYPEDVVAETEPPKIINYVPKLAMTSSTLPSNS